MGPWGDPARDLDVEGALAALEAVVGDQPLRDVREPFEWGISNLGEYGAKLIPMGELAERLEELDPSEEIVLQCRSGNRSAHAVQFLRSRGYPNVANLHGGILAWSDEIDSSKKKY